MDALRPDEMNNKQSMMDLFDKLSKRLRNLNHSVGGIAIGSGDTSKVKLANTVVISADGKPVSVTTAEYSFTAGDDIEANAASVQEAIYVLTLDVNGAGTLTKGPTATGSGNAVYPDYDDLPEDEAVVGAVRIAVAAGSTDFDAGSDALSAAHITDTYYDLTALFPLFEAAQ